MYWHIEINGVRMGQVWEKDQQTARELACFIYEVKPNRQEKVRAVLAGKSYHVGVFGFYLFNGVA